MTNYHVGYGATGIFAGTLNATNTMWVSISDVTDEAISAVAQYLLEREEVLVFKYQGKEYRLSVEPQHKLSIDLEKIDCKSTKCENCINHNYCDFELQESEVENAE